MNHLHIHTEYSFLDGACSIEEIPKKAKEVGSDAVAISDHGNVHALVDFYKACKKEDIKPIIGCEFYLADDRTDKSSRDAKHIVLLAKNETGRKNLNKIATDSYKNGFYYKPRTDFDVIKDHSEGLICLSACLAGPVAQALLNDQEDKARELITKYKDLFGDDFYLEIQANKLEEQYKINTKLVELSRKMDVELVATNDVHYLEKEDAQFHDVTLAVQTKAELDDEDRFSFDNNEFYFKDEAEMREDLFMVNSSVQEEIDQAIENTHRIADKCNVELELGNVHLPEFPIPEGYTTEEWLRKRAYEELFNYATEEDIDINEYADQLAHELEVIINKGYAAYFLIVADFIQWAKDQGILVGPGRGSAAGCLLSYLLNITAVDPIEHGLYFERFLNPQRASMPDIDIDFLNARRDEVIEYVTEKYGEEKVAHIATFTTQGVKGAIKDIGRTLGYSFDEMNQVTKVLPNGLDSIEEALEDNETLQRYKEQYPKVFEYAKQMIGKPRQASTHACAMVITPEPVDNYVPLMVNDGDVVTQTEMKASEKMGLLKMDFLGLKTLDVINDTIKAAHKRSDIDDLYFTPTVDNIWEIPKDDDAVYENIYSAADNSGIFQMESDLFDRLLEKMQPNKFEHITALLALGRPGPLEGGIVDDYIDCLHGAKEPEYPHEDLEEVLEETFGLMIYQEDLLRVAQVIGGYSLGSADLLRRGVGKKIPEILEEQKEIFVHGDLDKEDSMNVPGAVNEGYSKELGEELFELIEYFSGYGFNKSHSTSYAYISYVSAWLKHYFTEEFYAACMTIEGKKSSTDSKLDKFLADCYRKDIEILPPDINESQRGFTAVVDGLEVGEDGKIRFGLESISHVGEAVIPEIIKNQPYDSFEDFIRTVDPGSQVVENLVYAGCFDQFEENRNKLLDDYETYKDTGNFQNTLFDLTEEITKQDIIEMENEAVGMSVSFPAKWYFVEDGAKAKLEGTIVDKNEIVDKNNQDMCFLTLQVENVGEVDIVVFSNEFGSYHQLLFVNNKVQIIGKKDSSQLLANKIKEIN